MTDVNGITPIEFEKNDRLKEFFKIIVKFLF